MNALQDLVANGDIALVACAFLLCEFVALSAAFRRPWKACAIALLPGAFLLLALWSALAGYVWPWAAVFLALSLPSHLLDLWSRRP